ncbi:endonuclease domain-containing protein [Lysobacter silvisoli]|uniref:Endonuclease domain-containing protein n=1 Tax=Lysobacter silvisoli TaxID=2293254 RepID=A0A371JZJ4_9GAMM|nr:DUF559 domain-containing protein [Lysobacter silvisoli]RDZ27020.1 endonuclease domain-containing protein [Lysobacter silvisoli]
MRSGQKRGFARHLRRGMTDAESRLWFHLRNRALDGRKFRRQVPIGPYVVDFVCVQARLALELDGGQYVGFTKDPARTAFLRKQGYRVLRFWNNDVLQRTDAVLEQVLTALAPDPDPTFDPT